MSYKIVDVEPGSEGWRQWRRKVRSASDAAVIMGCAPSYWERRTWADLRSTVPRPAPSYYTRQIWAYGHAREEAYRERYHPHLSAVNLQRGDYGASLDIAELGAPLGSRWWEVKSPIAETSKMWEAAQSAEPWLIRSKIPHVWWQLVHQAYVVGDDMSVCYLVVNRPTGVGQVTIPIPHGALVADWRLLKSEWEAYAAGLDAGIRDEGWDTAAKAYLEADDALKEATADRKRARERLLALAEEEDDPRGAGVAVSTSKREGRVDYKTMAFDLVPDLPDDDWEELAEKYRKPGFTVQTIRRIK